MFDVEIGFVLNLRARAIAKSGATSWSRPSDGSHRVQHSHRAAAAARLALGGGDLPKGEGTAEDREFADVVSLAWALATIHARANGIFLNEGDVVHT